VRRLANVYRLGVKELYSLRRDRVLLILILWSFSLSIYTAATGMSHDLNNAAVAVVDEDRSALSAAIRDALLPPRFQPPRLISFQEIDAGLDREDFTFALVIPAGFEAEVLAGRPSAVQLNIDATAMAQAGIGDGVISAIVAEEVAAFLAASATEPPVLLIDRYAFNPTLESAWFTGVMELINNVSILAILLAGAALIREREHGTIEHLLVMPLSPFEIMLAKVWANGLVILVASSLSLFLVVRALLAVPLAGSPALFLLGVSLYLFFATALGIFLATIARTMPQFGLLFILVILPMNLLSGGETPIESQPAWLQSVMGFVPATQFVSFAQAILFRGADLSIVWPQFLMIVGIGGLFFAVSALRFRSSIIALQR